MSTSSQSQVDWARTRLAESNPAVASLEDYEIPVCVDTADEAIALLRERRAQWTSGVPR